jgi:hypothetical protein
MREHAGDGRDGFENDGAVAVLLGEKSVGGEAQKFGEARRETIRKSMRNMMDHGLHVMLCGKAARIGLEYRIHHAGSLHDRCNHCSEGCTCGTTSCQCAVTGAISNAYP